GNDNHTDGVSPDKVEIIGSLQFADGGVGTGGVDISTFATDKAISRLRLHQGIEISSTPRTQHVSFPINEAFEDQVLTVKTTDVNDNVQLEWKDLPAPVVPVGPTGAIQFKDENGDF